MPATSFKSCIQKANLSVEFWSSDFLSGMNFGPATDRQTESDAYAMRPSCISTGLLKNCEKVGGASNMRRWRNCPVPPLADTPTLTCHGAYTCYISSRIKPAMLTTPTYNNLPLLFIGLGRSAHASLSRSPAHIVTLLVHGVLVLQNVFGTKLIAIQSVLLTYTVWVGAEQSFWGRPWFTYWWHAFMSHHRCAENARSGLYELHLLKLSHMCNHF